MSGRTSSAGLDKTGVSRSLGGWSSMPRRPRYILWLMAGLFAGLTIPLPAEPPPAITKGATRKAVPASTTAPVPPGKAGADLQLQMSYAAYEAGNLSLALEKLEAADKLRPNNAESANLRGAILLRSGQFAKAGDQFRRAVNLDPNLWVARFNVAEVPFRQKDFAAARRAFENLAFETDRYKLDAEWELVQYKLIVCALLTNDAADAQKRFTRLRSNPASTAKIYAQAALSFAKNDAASATKVLALAGTPGSAALKAIYADALVAAGWVTPPAASNQAYDTAPGQRGSLRVRGLPVPLLPPALEIDLPKGSGSSLAGDSALPMDELPMTNLPAREAGTPSPKVSPEKSETAPKASPAPKDSSDVRVVGDGRYADNRGNESEWILAANEAVEPYAAKISEAQAKLRAKDLEGASQLLEEAIAMNPKPAEALNLRGALEFYRGNYRVAEALFRKALLADPTNWPARFDLAEISFVEKDYAKARGQYEGMLGGTSVTKQPVERELLQYKIVLTHLLEGKLAAAEKLIERLPLAGQTPARYYSQIALDVLQKRFEKAAQALQSAEQYYPASLNFIFAQSLEKLAMLPLPGTASPVAAFPAAARPNPTPQDEAPVRADLLPPPVSDASPAVELTESALARTEAQLLEEIVGGRNVGSPPAAKPSRSPTTAVAPAAAIPSRSTVEPAAAATARAAVPASTGSAHGWLAGALQWLFPGTEPTRLETLLFALGAVNLLGLMYLLGADVIARFIRPRKISIHTAGAVGVSVNRLHIIERFRVRLSVANMTRHSQTVGHLDTVVVAPDGVRRTFHWKTLCLNPSGSSSSFEEMDVFPLILLPGEVASLYVDFVADAEEAPTAWRRGKHEFHVKGWAAAATRRATPDFKVSFPLEIPNIPWKNQDIVVDLAIVRPGRKENVPSEFELLDWDEEDPVEIPPAEQTAEVDLAFASTAPLAAAAAEATTLPPSQMDEALPPAVVQPPPPSVVPARSSVVVTLAAPSQDVLAVREDPNPSTLPVVPVAPPPARIPPIAAAFPTAAPGHIRPVTPVMPAPARANPDAAHASTRPPLSRTPFLSGPGKTTTTTPQVLPALGRPASSTPAPPIEPLVPMVKPFTRLSTPVDPLGKKPPTAATDPREPRSPSAPKLPARPPEPPPGQR